MTQHRDLLKGSSELEASLLARRIKANPRSNGDWFPFLSRQGDLSRWSWMCENLSCFVIPKIFVCCTRIHHIVTNSLFCRITDGSARKSVCRTCWWFQNCPALTCTKCGQTRRLAATRVDVPEGKRNDLMRVASIGTPYVSSCWTPELPRDSQVERKTWFVHGLNADVRSVVLDTFGMVLIVTEEEQHCDSHDEQRQRDPVEVNEQPCRWFVARDCEVCAV